MVDAEPRAPVRESCLACRRGRSTYLRRASRSRASIAPARVAACSVKPPRPTDRCRSKSRSCVSAGRAPRRHEGPAGGVIPEAAVARARRGPRAPRPLAQRACGCPRRRHVTVVGGGGEQPAPPEVARDATRGVLEYAGHLLGLQPWQRVDFHLPSWALVKDAVKKDRVHMRIQPEVTRRPWTTSTPPLCPKTPASSFSRRL